MLASRTTANERFKRTNSSRTWGGIAVAAALHFAVIALWPAATPEPLGAQPNPDTMFVVQPPLPPLPPPPEDVPRPAHPVITVDAIDDITISPNVGPDAPRVGPPPPPVRRGNGDDPGVFIPHTVKPELVNQEAVERELRRRYPSHLRDAGVEGTTLLWVKVGTDGRVAEARVEESSGLDAFDRVALEVADAMVFRPALNLDQKVALWVQIPIQFTVR
ncbi:MAG: energy transducer TonB [Gemmatimonadota bacterium]